MLHVNTLQMIKNKMIVINFYGLHSTDIFFSPQRPLEKVAVFLSLEDEDTEAQKECHPARKSTLGFDPKYYNSP